MTVLHDSGIKHNAKGSCCETKWLCMCDCGNQCVIRGSYLRNGHTKTCGWCQKYISQEDHMVCVSKNGKQFLYDFTDQEFVSKHRWYVDRYGYVLIGSKNRFGGKLHRMLVQPDPDQVVDHINGDPSDCRRSNLRIVCQGQNTCNQKLHKRSTTGYKGVCYDKRRHAYMAYIRPQRQKFLGYYPTPEEAANAYNIAAITYFGEHARLNIIGQPFTTISAMHQEKMA